jgi:uncharacterized phage-associated protein
VGDNKLTRIHFRFNKAKALEVILYLAQKLPVPNVYGICKTLYLADKLSLEKYGRFIFGESYVAMNEGATPSKVYDLLKQIEGNPTEDIKITNHKVIPLRQANTHELSKSDIECLEKIITKYGPKNRWEARKKACHDTAYQKAWEKKGTNNSVPITIESIAEMLDDSETLIDYLANSG